MSELVKKVATTGGKVDLNTLIMVELLKQMRTGRDSESAEGVPSLFGGDGTERAATGVERSLKSLHSMKKRIHARPREVIEDSIQTVKERLGVEDGQAWALSDLNRRISWGRQKLMQRMHFMLGEIFTRLDRGEALEAQALTAQCMKAVHQAALDDGKWQVAWHSTSLRDPLRPERFAGSEKEIEAISAYIKAQDDLEQKVRKDRRRDDGGGDGGEGQPHHPERGGPKGGGRGRGRGQASADANGAGAEH